MISVEKAKIIGIDFCDNLIGKEYVERYAGTSTAGFGKIDDKNIFCFVGVDDRPRKRLNKKMIRLSPNKRHQFPVRASCLVSLTDGAVTKLECVKPKRQATR